MKQLYYSIFIILALLWNTSCNDEDKEPEVKLAVVSTSGNVTELTAACAIIEGNLIADGLPGITQKGICYSTKQDPTIEDKLKTKEGTTVGPFKVELNELESATTYYARTYAINSAGVAYGNQISFTTKDPEVLPVVETEKITDILLTSANVWGKILKKGNPPFTEYGVCYSTEQNPDIQSLKTIGKMDENIGDEVFVILLTHLTPNTTYYVRAYVTDNYGNTHYSTQTSFKTLDPSSGSSSEWGDGGTWKP